MVLRRPAYAVDHPLSRTSHLARDLRTRRAGRPRPDDLRAGQGGRPEDPGFPGHLTADLR